jgi:CHASE3 domain sensor protein
MQGKKIINYILASFIIGTFVLVYMQYHSAKSIDSLITGNEKMVEEFKTENELKEIEKDVIYIESKVRGIVSTDDSSHAEGIEKQILEIERNLNQLQQIADDDSSAKYIDELDTLVKQKLAFQTEIFDAYQVGGKNAADNIDDIPKQTGRN